MLLLLSGHPYHRCVRSYIVNDHGVCTSGTALPQINVSQNHSSGAD